MTTSSYWTRVISNIELLDKDEKNEYERSVRPAPTTVEQAMEFATADIDDLFGGNFDSGIHSVKDWKEFDQILERLVLECHEIFQQKNKT